MDLTIEPEAAATLAEDAEDPETKRFYERIAAGDEPYTGEVAQETVNEMLLSMALLEIRDSVDEIADEIGLTRYDAGRLRGVIEALAMMDKYDSLPKGEVTDDEVAELFPEPLDPARTEE